MSAKGKTVFVAILASLLALTSCSDDEQVRVNDEETQASAAPRVGAERTIDQTAGESAAGSPAAGREGGAIARAGDNAVARAGDGAAARAGEVEARTNGGGGSTHEVTLGIGGDHGMQFSGVCSVGGQETVIGGRVPERYVYHPADDKLECEIRKQGGGILEVVLVAGSSVRSVQRTDAQKSTINFAYSNGGLSSSVSSSSD